MSGFNNIACDYCGEQHPVEPAHTDQFSGAQLYVAVCGGFSDYYTAERFV